MAKGCWIARMDAIDPEVYGRYRAANGAVFAKFGGWFLIRGGQSIAMEGSNRSCNVVLEFDSYKQALACYNSSEYTGSVKRRRTATS